MNQKIISLRQRSFVREQQDSSTRNQDLEAKVQRSRRQMQKESTGLDSEIKWPGDFKEFLTGRCLSEGLLLDNSSSVFR